ncbi:MAG: ComF family protein [Candidatus Competibacteraceae bacterium]
MNRLLTGIFGKPPGTVNPGASAMIAVGAAGLQRLLLPPTCLLCGADGALGRDLCAGCAADLPRNHTACPGCAIPLAGSQNGFCAKCQAEPRSFARTFAPFRYQPPVDFLIRGLKFEGRLSHARLLGELFAAALAERTEPLPDCIIPVPLHPRRLRERGFNQALELARAAAARFRIPLLATGLRRVHYTTPQTRLDAHHRQINPLGAFASGRWEIRLRVALIDDVMTTGSTVGECARVLRAGGVNEVEVWALGRTGASV